MRIRTKSYRPFHTWFGTTIALELIPLPIVSTNVNYLATTRQDWNMVLNAVSIIPEFGKSFTNVDISLW